MDQNIMSHISKAMPSLRPQFLPLPRREGWPKAGVGLILFLLVAGLFAFIGFTPAHAQTTPQPVISADAPYTTPVGGMERTNATSEVLPVTGQPFSRELRVTIRAASDQTNATQLTMPIGVPVQKGDVLLASFYVRGSAAGGKPAHIELLFERTVDPWTKSVIHDAQTSKNPQAWTRVVVPFAAAETYQPAEAMVSLRFAFG